MALTLRSALLTAITLAFVVEWGAHAQVRLADDNSVVFVDPYSSRGMYSWNLNGWEQLHQQWFWYGIGSGPVNSIDSLTLQSVTSNSARQASISYASPGVLGASVSFLLTGGTNVPIGPSYDYGWATATMDATLTITNLSNVTLPFHLYQYAQFDVSHGYDTAALTRDVRSSLCIGADQYSGYGPGYSVQTVPTPGANHGEVGFVGDTLAKLYSGGPVTLSDFDGPLSSGPVTWALEWDLNLEPGSSATIGVEQSIINLRNLPEPTATTLMGFGAVAWMLWHRRTAPQP